MIFIITISGADRKMLFYVRKKTAEDKEGWRTGPESGNAWRTPDAVRPPFAALRRSVRRDALEEIHKKQKQLDRLDMLIRDAKNMQRRTHHEA